MIKHGNSARLPSAFIAVLPVISLFVAGLLAILTISQAAALEKKPHSEEEIELGGLLVNETITRLGTRFYEVFSNRWIPPRGINLFHVVFRERPDPRWGTYIWVTVNDDMVFAQRFSRRASLEAAVNRAIRNARRYLLTMKLRVDQGDIDLDESGL